MLRQSTIINLHDENMNKEMEHEDHRNNSSINSSGCADMSLDISSESSSVQMSPPSRRKLRFATYDTNFLTPAPPPKFTCSPPYKRIRQLKLFDTPYTPKTILEKSTECKAASTGLPKNNLFSDKPRGVPSAYPEKEEIPVANVNPFTPNRQILAKKRKSLSMKSPNGALNDTDWSDQENEQPTKRLALRDNNVTRYHSEFLELKIIGKGQFGAVYKCVNRLDGYFYAIKKSKKPIAGSASEKAALNEVYAHAVLGKHQHVVRYYSAWAEDNHMIIQNEYCNGGSLADKISKSYLDPAELRRVLLHVGKGLRYIHSEGLVHLDIKPGNIFISIEKKMNLLNYDSMDDGFADSDDSAMYREEITYKIGDLGHVTSITDPKVEEGDCRYLPMEIMRDDYSHLPKADIFSLGLTVLECAGTGPLPKNGSKWHEIRRGILPELPQKLPKDLLILLKAMIHKDPTQRPNIIQLLQHRSLNPDDGKSKADLTRELNAEKIRNEMLSKQLKEAAVCIHTITQEQKKNSARLIGKKVNRSVSTTTF